MLGKIIPVLFLAVGLAAGAGAGFYLKPEDTAKEVSEETYPAPPKASSSGKKANTEFVKLNNQFVVPVIEQAEVSSLVVLSLSLEATYGLREAIYEREPKLRDSFLRVLFDHANMGGFSGAFTESSTMELLRNTLKEAAQNEIGPEVSDVLIGSISRQDI